MVSLNPLSRMKEKSAVAAVVLFGKNEEAAKLQDFFRLHHDACRPSTMEDKKCGQSRAATALGDVDCRVVDPLARQMTAQLVSSAVRKTKHSTTTPFLYAHTGRVAHHVLRLTRL